MSVPEAWSRKNPDGGPEPNARYSILKHHRADTYEVLTAALSLADDKKELTTEQRSTILRFVGRYADESDVYEHMHKGLEPTGTPLPPYLTEFVDSREAEKAIAERTESLLPLQFDVRKNAKISEKIYPSMLVDASHSLINAFIRHRTRMDRVLACAPNGEVASDSAPFVALLQAAHYVPNKDGSYPEKTINAARLLVGYLVKYKKEIQKYADIKEKGDINAVLITQGLDCAADGSIAGQLMQRISDDSKDMIKGIFKGEMPEMRDLISKGFEGGKMISARAAEVLLAPLSQLDADPSKNTEEQRVQFQIDAARVVEFFSAHKKDPISQLPNDFGGKNENQLRMINAVIDKVTGPENADKTIDHIRKATMMTDAKSPILLKMSEIIKNKELHGSECMELFYLMNTQGGDFLLAYKLIDILGSHKETGLAKDLQIHLFKTFRDIALSSADDIKVLAKKLQLSPEQEIELENARQRLDELGVNMIYGFLETYGKMLVEFPFLVGFLTFLTMKTPAKFALKVWYTFDIKKMENYMKIGYEEAKKEYKLDPSVSRESFEGSKKVVKDALIQYDLIFRRLHIPLRTPAQKLTEVRNVVKAMANGGNVDELAQAYKSQFAHPGDALYELRKGNHTDAKIRAALIKAGYDPKGVDAAIAAPVETVSNQNAAPSSQPLVAQPAPNQSAPATSVAAPQTAPASKVPPPSAPPKRRTYFNPDVQNTEVSAGDLVLNNQTSVADLHKIAAEVGVTVDGKSDADVRAEVSAKLKGKK